MVTIGLGLLFLGLVVSSFPESSQPLDAYEIAEVVGALSKGNRLLGINISEGALGFDAAFSEVQSAGIEVIELNIPWDEIEIDQGQYQDPWGILDSITFYGEHNISVGFSLGVIDTVERRTPDYLDGLAYDDPQVIEAFNSMIDWFLGNVPSNVNILSLSIGNEVDLVLEGETWSQYTRFFAATSQHVRANFPQVMVGVKITVMNGVFGDELAQVQRLNNDSDVVMLTYYPLEPDFEVLETSIVHQHFEQITASFPQRLIWLMEVGYPAGSEYNASSQSRQAEFIHELFAAWDDHTDEIGLIILNWLHDQSPEMIDAWRDYYGNTPGLVEYLSTLGLRTYDGQDKPAWWQLLYEVQARGW
jgi:hypothetical protein